MKKAIVFLCLLAISMSCHKDSLDLTPEVEATILGWASPPYAGCDFGFTLMIGTKEIVTKLVSDPYSKAGTLVWIRYKPDEACMATPTYTDAITITSIRSR